MKVWSISVPEQEKVMNQSEIAGQMARADSGDDGGKEAAALLYRSDEIGYNIIMTYCDEILKGRDI